jgi:hypothetical protein
MKSGTVSFVTAKFRYGEKILAAEGFEEFANEVSQLRIPDE